MAQALMVPMLGHVALTSLLYVLLTVARAPKVWGIGKRKDGLNPWGAVEPRIGANLSNQFELPLLFYVACLLLLWGHATGITAVILAWVFLAGRVAHSCVQIFGTNIRLRGAVFTVNFLATLGLWAVVVRHFVSAAA